MRINTSFTAFGLWGRRSSAGLWHIQWATGDDAPISAVFLQAKLRNFLDSGGKLPYIMSNYISESTKKAEEGDGNGKDFERGPDL